MNSHQEKAQFRTTLTRKPSAEKTKRGPQHTNQRRYEGHEIILSSVLTKKVPMAIHLMNGNTENGLVTQFDRYTISLRRPDGSMTTIFKHAIIQYDPA